MIKTTEDAPIELVVTRGDLELVRAALRLLLSVEDDPETITELKELIARLPPRAG
jgi:hypothetical protein